MGPGLCFSWGTYGPTLMSHIESHLWPPSPSVPYRAPQKDPGRDPSPCLGWALKINSYQPPLPVLPSLSRSSPGPCLGWGHPWPPPFVLPCGAAPLLTASQWSRCFAWPWFALGEGGGRGLGKACPLSCHYIANVGNDMGGKWKVCSRWKCSVWRQCPCKIAERPIDNCSWAILYLLAETTGRSLKKGCSRDKFDWVLGGLSFKEWLGPWDKGGYNSSRLDLTDLPMG